jgi:hypothetical protein
MVFDENASFRLAISKRWCIVGAVAEKLFFKPVKEQETDYEEKRLCCRQQWRFEWSEGIPEAICH